MKKILKSLSVFLAILLLLLSVLTACSEPPVEQPPETEAETEAPPPVEDPVPEHIAEIFDTKHTLKVREDGSFRVLVISDVQSIGITLDDFIRNNIVELVVREDPDLVLFLGDNTVNMTDEYQLRMMLTDMTAYIEARKIPWAHVYGNHDDENGALTKEEQQRVYESFEYCVSRTDSEDIYGVGNYVLPVLNSDGDGVAFNLFAFDSGTYLSAEEQASLIPSQTTFPGYYGACYDYIRPSQIEWYVNTSRSMEEYFGEKIPALAYFHIPLQENYTAWENRGDLVYEGEKREYIGASPINSGLFTTMLDRGDVKAVVTGHDHMNDYAIDYCGIKLCSAASIGNEYYYADDMMGGRVFIFNEAEPDTFKTYMSYTCERNEDYTLPSTAIASGTAQNFEGDGVRLDVTAIECSREDYQKYDQIKYDIFEDKGVNGSSAFGVTRTGYSSTPSQNTVECRISLDNIGTVGSNRYLRVWLDLRGDTTAVDLGKMSLGVCVDRQACAPHTTTSLGGAVTYYYLAEGSDTWTTLTADQNGYIGTDAGVSLEGLCGWFAVELDDLYQPYFRKMLTSSDCVTDMFIFFTQANESMTGQYIYIDDIAFVENYTDFN